MADKRGRRWSGAGPIGPGKIGTVADEQRTAALRMGLFALEKAMGGTIDQIARKYQVAKDDVREALTQAERLEFLEAYRDLVRDRLIPKAMVVYEMKLREGNLEAARDLLYGSGVLSKNNAPPTPGEEVESLLAWRVRRQATKELTMAPPVLEGEVTT